MISCCEIALASIVANVICLAICRNYYVKMKGLTVELKKKDGHEQGQIDEIRKEVEILKKKKLKTTEKKFSNSD